MDCYVFSSEPADATYRDLIKFCCSIASEMLLVVRDPALDPGAAIRGMLDRLDPHLMESARSNKWPGTILLTDQATVYRYRVSPDLASLLSETMTRLFGWLHPEAPEDLCFCRRDGEPLLVTTSHEHDAYLLLSASEQALLASRYPDLAALLREE